MIRRPLELKIGKDYTKIIRINQPIERYNNILDVSFKISNLISLFGISGNVACLKTF